MTQYGEILKRPFTDFTKLLIGIVLSIFPIINFFAMGYILECAKTAQKKQFDLPEWKNMGDLFVSGFFMFILSIIYAIPALIIFGIVIGLNISLAIQGNIAGALAQSLLLLLLGTILLILGWYFGTGAILNYGMSGRLEDGFKLSEISRRIFKGPYTKNFVVGIAITLVIVGVLSLIPIIGVAIGTFVAGVIFFSLLGEAYDY